MLTGRRSVPQMLVWMRIPTTVPAQSPKNEKPCLNVLASHDCGWWTPTQSQPSRGLLLLISCLFNSVSLVHTFSSIEPLERTWIKCVTFATRGDDLVSIACRCKNLNKVQHQWMWLRLISCIAIVTVELSLKTDRSQVKTVLFDWQSQVQAS